MKNLFFSIFFNIIFLDLNQPEFCIMHALISHPNLILVPTPSEYLPTCIVSTHRWWLMLITLKMAGSQ